MGPRPPLRSSVPWALAAELAQLILGLAAFSLLAIRMDAEQFGIYSAAVAYATLGMTISYFGSQQILMLDNANGVVFAEVWARTLSVALAGSVLTSVVLTLAQPLLLPELDWRAFFAIILAQTALFGVIDLAVIAAQAHRSMITAALIRVVSGAARLLSVLAYGWAGTTTAAGWAPWAVLGWGVAAVGALVVVSRAFSAPFRLRRLDFDEVRRGAPFVFAASTTSVLDAADRPMLVRFGFSDDAGRYAAAFRVAALASIPFQAVVRSTDADFYEDGALGIERAVARAKRFTLVAVTYGVFAFAVLVIIAPLVPALLGADYEGAQNIVRALAALPLLRGAQIFFANSLTGSGLQRLRNRALLIATLVNIGLNVILIPRLGWSGAVAATLLAEALLAALLCIYALGSARRVQAAEPHRV